MLQNTSGPFSRKTPRSTNPANFSLPPRQQIDAVIDPIISQEDFARGDLRNLYTSNSASFRNQSYDLDWRTKQDLADHEHMHVREQTFGTGPEAQEKILEHQTLMFNGMLSGMSFLEAHKYALRVGPKPLK